MATKARLETQITGDESPFVQALTRAEKRAQSFQGRLQGLFRRDPMARAERAVSGFLGGIASGDIQGAVVGITERMRGLGLAAGVGIGAAVIIFQKAKEQIDEVDKSVQRVNADLARPLSLQSALGPAGIGKEIDSTGKALDDLIDKRKGMFQQIRESAIRSQPGVTGDPYTNAANKIDSGPDSVPAAARAQEAAEKRLKQLAMARADAELDAANAKKVSVTGSEREALWLKSSVDYQKRIAEIQLESGLTKPGRSAEVLLRRMNAAKIEHETEFQAAAKRIDLRRQEEVVENRILDLQGKGLTHDEQSAAALKERIGLLKQRLTQPGTDAEKGQIQTQLHGLQNEEMALRYKNRFDGPALYTPEKGEAANFANWVKIQQRLNPDAAMGPKAAGSGSQLGSTGVLDRIEKNTELLGANK